MTDQQSIKESWDKLAAILGVDSDDAGAMLARARIVMAAFESSVDPDIAEASAAFPIFAHIRQRLDEALLYEYGRFGKHVEEAAREVVRLREVEARKAIQREAQGMADGHTSMLKPAAWLRKIVKRRK